MNQDKTDVSQQADHNQERKSRTSALTSQTSIGPLDVWWVFSFLNRERVTANEWELPLVKQFLSSLHMLKCHVEGVWCPDQVKMLICNVVKLSFNFLDFFVVFSPKSGCSIFDELQHVLVVEGEADVHNVGHVWVKFSASLLKSL